MNPLEDTLNHGPTLPRQVASQGRPTAGGLLNDLDLQQTVRMPGAGTLVFGRYRLQRVLGRGGMGVVWLAVDTKLERAVALKFLPDAVGADPAALKELKDETRRGLDLAHPNIVRIYDFVDDEGAAAISMEFVDGKSLSEQRITLPHHVFTVDEIAPWVGQMCDALDYAHIQKRIVHRDLKPANLMVNSDSQIKITDFGISCSVTDTMSRLSRTMHQGTSGTLLYMSPQQAMGDRPRATDDIYAVGATLFELLTGKPPFYRGDITTQITSKVAPKLRDRREELEIAAKDEIPKQWEDAIAACLDKDPARRPQSAGELAQMLGVSLRAEVKPTTPVKTKSGSLRPLEVAASRPTEAEKEKAPPSPMVKWLILATLLMLLLAAVGGGGIWWWMNRPGEWQVQTEPAGATVTMGTKTVKSPATISDLKPGNHEAVVTMENYEPQNVAFKVLPGQPAVVGTVSLTRSTGKLIVSSDPDNVPFEVKSITDSTLPPVTGVTPRELTLPVGEYDITMKHSGEIINNDAKVVRGGEIPVSFKFAVPAPLPPPVIASTTPPPAPAAPMPSSAETPPSSADTPPAPAAPLPPPASSTASNSPPPAMPQAPHPAASAPTDSNAATMAAAQQQQTPGPGAPPLPAGAAATSDPAAGQSMATAIGGQAPVGDPPEGFWKLEEIFGGSNYSGYSEPGRRHLLYRAQQKLDISADGKPGKGTHKAIQDFQKEKSLPATGQLDPATVAELGLADQKDNSTWSSPRGSSNTASRSSSSSDRTPESDKTKARKFIEKKILGGRDLRDLIPGR